MNTCKVCSKGYCESRVRKVFGHLPRGYCSPQCFTASHAEFPKKEVAEKFGSEVAAMKLFDAMYENGFIAEDVAGDPGKYYEAIKVLVKFLKEMEK